MVVFEDALIRRNKNKKEEHHLGNKNRVKNQHAEDKANQHPHMGFHLKDLSVDDATAHFSL